MVNLDFRRLFRIQLHATTELARRAGRGEFCTLATNRTEAVRAKNRRVEFVEQ